MTHNRLLTVMVMMVTAGALGACFSQPPHAEDRGDSDRAVSAGEPAETERATSERGGDAVRLETDARAAEEATEREGGEHREHAGTGEHEEGAEHAESSSGEGEEAGVYIARTDTWNTVRNGTRLVLAYDSATNAFLGRVENQTASTLCAVRVEVHLSTGTELGPTEPTDLPPGQSVRVEVASKGGTFETWTAHPEISPCST